MRLLVSCSAGDVDSVVRLLRFGVSPSFAGPQGQTPLHCAVLAPDLKLQRRLDLVLRLLRAPSARLPLGYAPARRTPSAAGHARRALVGLWEGVPRAPGRDNRSAFFSRLPLRPKSAMAEILVSDLCD